MNTWEQDFMSDDWAFCRDGKTVLWVSPCKAGGRDAFVVLDADQNQIGGVDATEESAKIRAVRIATARGLLE